MGEDNEPAPAGESVAGVELTPVQRGLFAVVRLVDAMLRVTPFGAVAIVVGLWLGYRANARVFWSVFGAVAAAWSAAILFLAVERRLSGRRDGAENGVRGKDSGGE